MFNELMTAIKPQSLYSIFFSCGC